jgi:hypothetical protein
MIIAIVLVSKPRLSIVVGTRDFTIDDDGFWNKVFDSNFLSVDNSSINLIHGC